MKKFRFLLITVLAMAIPVIFSEILPKKYAEISFSLSLSIKALFVFLLPLVIFSFIFCSMVKLNAQKAIRFVLLLLVCVFCSNCLAIFTGYFIGSFVANLVSIPILIPHTDGDNLSILWNLGLKPLFPNEYGLIGGFLLGICCSIFQTPLVHKLALILNKSATYVLKYLFVPLLPIYVLGWMFKLEYEGLLSQALEMSRGILIIVVSSQIIYMCFIYSIAARFSPSKFVEYFKNVLPATLTGFSTASSASALPVLLMASSKNIGNENAAKVIIPATVNIHTLGSALAITILCITTLTAFGMTPPSIEEFYVFGFLYAISKFAVAGVPGGVILIVSPIIEAYLHFSSDMLALITGIYFIFDPFGTATNVTGNGAFAIIFDRMSRKFNCKIE